MCVERRDRVGIFSDLFRGRWGATLQFQQFAAATEQDAATVVSEIIRRAQLQNTGCRFKANVRRKPALQRRDLNRSLAAARESVKGPPQSRYHGFPPQ